MKLSKAELQSFKPVANYVLLEAIYSTKEIKFLDGKLLLAIDYHPEDHQEVVCRVQAVPMRLVYDRRLPLRNEAKMPVSLEWKTAMEVKIDDIVWISYLAMIKAEVFTCEDKNYFLIPYDKLYFKKTGKSITMLNGYVLIEPEYKQYLESETVDTLQYQVPTQFATIAAIGKPVEEYYDFNVWEDNLFRVNDRVMMADRNLIFVEAKLHQTLEKRYAVSRRPRLLGIMRYESPDRPCRQTGFKG